MSLPDLVPAGSLVEAVGALVDLGPDGAPFAGGTWIMRAPLRREPYRRRYVLVRDLAELRANELDGGTARLGASISLADARATVAGAQALVGLAAALAQCGSPAVRNVATIGGSICATPYATSDLVPALLACEASVLLTQPGGGEETVALADLLARRASLAPGELVLAIEVPAPAGRRSAFVRTAVRAGGDETVASVAVSADLDGAGRVVAARVAVGAVEAAPRRVAAAEATLLGSVPSVAAGEDAGRVAAGELEPRDGLDAPAWYRLEVVPALVRDAVSSLAS